MSSSSTVPQCRPHVSELLSKLIAAQNVDTRLWLRGEMVRLVDPMIDSLFLGLLISSSAQPSKQTNIRSTMSELCQLIEGEKETTNRLVRGQMDRLVNSLFLRLTNKALVNIEVSAFASVQPSPSNHQTVPPNASIAQSSTIDCEKGICRLDGENDAETGVDMQIGLDEDENEQDQQNSSLESDLMLMPNVIDNSNQFANNATDFSLINKSDVRSVRKSTRNATNQNSENGQSAQSVTEHNHQSTPSSSGLRSSARKRNPKKVCGDAQTNVRKSEKRKSGQATKNVKNRKRKQILDDDEDIDTDDRDDDQEDHADIGAEITTKNLTQPNLAQSNRHLQCSHCHKSFEYNSSLQLHLRVHTGERPFQCDLCGKRFSQIGNLTLHQLIHQNIKLFRCPECDKQFTRKHVLDSHLLTHSGERPFACRHCDLFFTDLSARNRPEQAIHLHVKPYRCKQCGHTATQRANIIRHIRAVHFGLPRTIEEQGALNIIDVRDPGKLVEKV